MQRAQGALPVDPFAVLQLDPSAARGLVIEAYFELVRAAASGGGREHLQEVHAAYAAAMAHAPDRATAAPPDHYGELRLDPGATAAMVELAFAYLQRAEPLPDSSIERYRREEAYRVLSMRRARERYDRERHAATMPGTGRREDRPDVALVSPRKEQTVTEKRKRGLFGRGRGAAAPDPRDERLLGLKDVLPVAPDEPSGEEAEALATAVAAAPRAEIVFTAGARAGQRVELDDNVIPVGEGKGAATVWRQGGRFMMRHNGKHVRIGGVTPSLAIVVLEDGDEVSVGADRVQFRILAD